MKNNIALITGITGQDGAYLAEFLLDQGYEVHGIKRRASSLNTERIDHLYQDPHLDNVRFFMHYGDMTDATNLIRLVQTIRPTEIYNLAANADALGTLRLLEAIRILGIEDRVRFYQASTSELFGNTTETPQTEQTPFQPRSPYATAKLFAYWITANYRDAYKMHASNGILFNHESPTRGETFVTRKITRAAVAIEAGIQTQLYLGNLNAIRDWGDARDFVEGMWKILQQKQPDDYILATGKPHSVREFVELAFAETGRNLLWEGKGLDERGIDSVSGEILVLVDKRYFRPTDVDNLIGNSGKAKKKLGWVAKKKFNEMVKEMIISDRNLLKINAHQK